MHICLVSREYPPFYGGGIGTYTVQFSRALAAAGHRVVVLTVSSSGTEEREQDGEVSVVRLPFIRGEDWSGPDPAIDTPEHRAAFDTFAAVSIFAMQVARALPKLHEEFAFDVVEAPDTGALAWFALNQRRLGSTWAADGPAMVTCIHSPTDWILHYNRMPLKHRADLELVAMERDSLRWSDGLVCPSAAVAAWASEHAGFETGRVSIIPYCLGDLEGVAREWAKGAAEADRGGSRRILFASRLEARKGVDTLLAGFAKAVGRGADLELDLVGLDTPAPGGRGQFGVGSLEELVPAEIRGRIRMHGKLDPEQVSQMQAVARAVAIPAPMDNFPFSCMEAMARGRVIIGARAGGVEQMLGEGAGLLFSPGDADSCSEALCRIAAMGDDELAAGGRRAAERIFELCGNDRILELRIGHYHDAISRRKLALASRAGTSARRSIIVNPGHAGRPAIDRLSQAVERGACDFAIGWLQLPAGDVVARSTPGGAPEDPRLSELGPVAVMTQAAAHPSIAAILHIDDESASTPSGAGLVAALLEAGFEGGVVPDVVTPVDAPHTLQPDRRLHMRALRRVVREANSVLRAIQAVRISAKGSVRSDRDATDYHESPGTGKAAGKSDDGCRMNG